MKNTPKLPEFRKSVKVVEYSLLSDGTDEEIDSRMLSEFAHAFWGIGQALQDKHTYVEQVERILLLEGYDTVYLADNKRFEFELRLEGYSKTINGEEYYKEDAVDVVRKLLDGG